MIIRDHYGKSCSLFGVNTNNYNAAIKNCKLSCKPVKTSVSDEWMSSITRLNSFDLLGKTSNTC